MSASHQGNSATTGIGDLELELGGVLRSAELTYVTYGSLARDGRNAVLLTHGYTSSHRFAEGGSSASEGSWSELVGPGKAIDTDRDFVVSSNVLGSSFGSTAPRSRNPATGRPYGVDFPPITLKDMVMAQKRLVDHLGVKGLLAVVGPSYGGYQAFAWGIEFPDFVQGLVPVVTGLRPPKGFDPQRLRQQFSTDPEWNGGEIHGTGGMKQTMTALRRKTLLDYGLEALLLEGFPEPAARRREIERLAGDWAESFDPHSLLVLGDALQRFDATPGLSRIRAKVLYVLSRTDAAFPPSLAAEVMPLLRSAGIDAVYAEIDSSYGHLASGIDAGKWSDMLRSFMESLQRAP